MKEQTNPIKDEDMEKVEAALRRARIRARETAKLKGTSLIIFKDGQIVKQRVD
jgi:hypothetical protein